MKKFFYLFLIGGLMLSSCELEENEDGGANKWGDIYTLTGNITIRALWEGTDYTLSYLWSYPVSVEGIESAHEYAANANQSWTVICGNRFCFHHRPPYLFEKFCEVFQ